ncbi:MAG: 3-hydroxybutyryl-CoA dehydrogenase [bacterium]
MEAIRRVGILGCGTMGAGIAQVVATAGYTTLVREPEEGLLQKGRERIEKGLERAVEKGKLDASKKDQARQRLSGVTSLEEMKDCHLIIEALPEEIGLKKEHLRKFDALCPASTILASNTSSLMITELAASTGRPEKVIGLHFFNPPAVMNLVEIVRTPFTSSRTLKVVQEFVASLPKTSILVPDRCGFVVNRLLIPYLLDAIQSLDNGLASVQDIDTGMRLGCGHPMGPLALSDFTGLDVLLHIAEVMFHEYRERRFAPPPLLRRMVLAGWLGKKTGRGFYDYRGPEPRAVSLGWGEA